MQLYDEDLYAELNAAINDAANTAAGTYNIPCSIPLTIGSPGVWRNATYFTFTSMVDIENI